MWSVALPLKQKNPPIRRKSLTVMAHGRPSRIVPSRAHRPCDTIRDIRILVRGTPGRYHGSKPAWEGKGRVALTVYTDWSGRPFSWSPKYSVRFFFFVIT